MGDQTNKASVNRKPTPNKRVSVTVRLTQATANWLKRQPKSQSEAIEDALRAQQASEPGSTTTYRWGRAAPDWIPGLPPAEFEVAWLRVITNEGGPSFAVLAARDGAGRWYEVSNYKAANLGAWIADESVTHWWPYQPPVA